MLPPNRRPICRTTCLLIACVVAMLPLVNCGRGDGPAAGEAPVVLRFWNGFTGPDGRTMLRLVQQFNRENPGVRVLMQRMDWGTYYNKLFVAGLGGRAPEVFVVHTDSLRRFVGAGLVRPVDDLVGPGQIDAADIDPNVWAAVASDGRHYAVPLDIHLLGMYYNRRLFSAAGIARPPTNREEFLDALRRLRVDANDDGLPEQWGFVFTWMRTNCYTFIRQNGGDLFAPDGRSTTIASPENVAAIQFASDLIRRERLAPGPENFDSWIGFRQGRVGIAFEGIYMLPELQRQTDLDFGAAPLPALFDRPAAWANSHNLCLRKDLDGNKLAAAAAFVRFLSDNSLEWAAGGQVPVRRSLRESAAFRAEPRFEAQREFAKQIPHAAYMPAVPFVFEYMVEYELAIEQALRGSVEPAAALQAAKGRIDRVIARYHSAGATAAAPEAAR